MDEKQTAVRLIVGLIRLLNIEKEVFEIFAAAFFKPRGLKKNN